MKSQVLVVVVVVAVTLVLTSNVEAQATAGVPASMNGKQFRFSFFTLWLLFLLY